MTSLVHRDDVHGRNVRDNPAVGIERCLTRCAGEQRPWEDFTVHPGNPLSSASSDVLAGEGRSFTVRTHRLPKESFLNTNGGGDGVCLSLQRFTYNCGWELFEAGVPAL